MKSGAANVRVGLLTGGQDPHYSHGLAIALSQKGVGVDFIGSDELDSPLLRAAPGVRFLNLRGNQDRKVSRKIIETNRGKLKIADPRAGQSGLVTISLPLTTA